MRLVWAFLMVVLPASVKRRLVVRFLGWDIDPTAYLGRSVVLVKHVSMGPGASIGPMNVIRDLEELRLGPGASIASRNWVTGWPLTTDVYRHSPDRDPSLVLGEGAMITVGHEIDCSDRVELGDYASLAGFRSQILTHSLDLVRDHFVTGPVVIGDRTAVMSGCMLLSGTTVPARTIVSAGSVVNTKLGEELTFYRGNPAEPVRSLPASLRFFRRGLGTTDASAERPLPPAAQ